MTIPFRLQPKPHVVPICQQDIQIQVERPDFILVYKPDGLLTVPGKAKVNHDSLYTRLKALFPEPRIVHRLDLDTSGVLAVAITQRGASELGKQFEKRSVKKEYIAVVDGLIESDEGEIDLPLICDWPNRPLQKVCHETGKTALTRYRVLERNTNEQTTRVSLEPYTGRSHQLRVHLAAIGHPILGCDMYAPEPVCYAAERLLLHATELTVTCPAHADPVSIKLPPPF